MEIARLSTRCFFFKVCKLEAFIKGPSKRQASPTTKSDFQDREEALLSSVLEKGVPLAGSFGPGSGPVPAATPPSGLWLAVFPLLPIHKGDLTGDDPRARPDLWP